jgi:hypothetical protein
MFEIVGFLYGLAKDLGEYLKWDEQVKLVDMSWPQKSGFEAEAEERGLQLRWSNPERLESRRLDGWDVVYEMDKQQRIRFRIENKSQQVLIAKPKEEVR